MGQIEDNKALVHRYVAAYNRHDLAAMDTILAPTYIDHAQPAGQPPQPPGPAFKKQIFAIFFQSFPDAQMTIEDLIAEGDRVAARLTMSGTHQQTFLGIPARGRRFCVPASNVYRIRDGMITDSWSILDMATLIRQIEDPEMSGYRRGEGPSYSENLVTTFTAPQPAKVSEYWARWEYSPEEWERFDQLDWGRATTALLVSAIGSVALTMGFVAFLTISTSDNFVPVLLIPMMLLMSFLLTYFLAGRRWMEARKRHQARKTGSRRVTIGVPSSFHDQGLWLAGTYIPLQETFLELKSVHITENPPLLHLRRKHVEIRQSSWHDTVPILIPRGHEAEAAYLVERFRAETIAPLKKDTSPSEP
jgi:steroid delta-isomerase-like uncharacterized protein